MNGQDERAGPKTWEGRRGAGQYEPLEAGWQVCWQAADAGLIGMCWTNTLPNLPPWGAADPRVGNNPLVLAVPRADGHVVLDMAMSHFSYGTLASYRMRG